MLVLSRKPGESIRIGEDMEVVVLDIRGDRIKLGFSGPRTVCVRRSELSEKKPALSRREVAVA